MVLAGDERAERVAVMVILLGGSLRSSCLAWTGLAGAGTVVSGVLCSLEANKVFETEQRRMLPASHGTYPLFSF